MPRVVVGTSGHVDHGKTSLIQALTGIDCDRWVEEKARGITIDLGFAHLTEEQFQIGFVDVPGHERFLHNALAGLGGIRIMLLVVAADEGVMPQTREHLAICGLLGIPAALVALTKADLVSPDLLELAQLEIFELLASTPFAGAAVMPVSSVTGAGLPALKEHIFRLAEAYHTDAGTHSPARLPVDRAFHLKGLGVVVTGTLFSGAVRPGDALQLLSGGELARVRSVQVHGRPREQALAGERVSLQLTGLELEKVQRGMQLVSPGAFAATTSLCTRFTLLADAPGPIRKPVPVRFHLYSGEVLGRLRPLQPAEIKPGESGLVQIRLNAPTVAVRGDRYVVRRSSPMTTIGGGEVLDPAWHPRRRRTVDAGLAALGGDLRTALLFWVRESGEGGIDEEELAQRLGWLTEQLSSELTQVAAAQQVREAPAGHGHGRRWLAPEAYEHVVSRARTVLGQYFENDRLARGMPKAMAVRRILPGRAAELKDIYLYWLETARVLTVEDDMVNLPDRRRDILRDESLVVESILDRFREAGLTTPVAAPPPAQQWVLTDLAERGKLVRLADDLWVDASAVSKVREDLCQSDWERFTVSQFKDRFRLTRRWAIPLLEHFDGTGVTRRVGNERLVVRGDS